MKTYSELVALTSFKARFEYLKLGSQVGIATFGNERYLNQIFYKSAIWLETRRRVIIRDNGFDLGCEGYGIMGKILVHHMNPITIQDILDRNPDIFNPEYLISCSHETHNAIHYGNDDILVPTMCERSPNDTCLWR